MSAVENVELKKGVIDVLSSLGWSITELHSVMAAQDPTKSKHCELAITKAKALVESANQRLQGLAVH